VKSGNYLTRSIAGLSTVGKNSSITRINGKLLAFDKWSATEIEDRQDMLIKLAKARRLVPECSMLRRLAAFLSQRSDLLDEICSRRVLEPYLFRFECECHASHARLLLTLLSSL
jgi:hypothetical protein